MPERRERDSRRVAKVDGREIPYNLGTGMGALADPSDYEQAAIRDYHRKKEEEIVDRHGDNMDAANAIVKQYRKEQGY